MERSSCLFLLLVSLSFLYGAAGAKSSPPKGAIIVDDLTGGETCERDRYYCAKGCEPKNPKDPKSPLPPDAPPPDNLKPFGDYPDWPLWGAYVEIISTSVTPVTLYINENNDVTTNMAMKFDTPYSVQGSDLWEVSTWFSKYEDGSAKVQTNLRTESLTQKQKNKSLKPDKTFRLHDLDQNVDLTDGSGCGRFKFICGEIRKNDPNPDFALLHRSRFSNRGCAQVTCKDRGSSEPKTVQFDSVKPSGAELYIGENNKISSDVAVTFNRDNTHPDVAGESLWQLAMWFSKDEDGFGRATGLIESALTAEQAAKPVDNFNEFIFAGLAMEADLRSSIGCGKYKYICAQIRKGKPVPDYEKIGKSRAATVGCSPVTCRSRDDGIVPDPNDTDGGRIPTDGDDDRGIEVVATSTTPVTLYLDEVNEVTTDVDIIFDTENFIKGSDLWEMSNWFSKQKDGSGRQTNLRESVLSPRQRSKSVKPDKALTYVDLPQSVDLTDGSGCGKFRYICSEIRKFNPTPDFKLRDRYKLSRRGCAQVTCKPRGDDTNPTVQFASVQPTLVTLYIGERTDVTTDVAVKFKEENTDPNTAGLYLWQMAVWFSKQEDGSGKTTDYVETTLSEAQGEMSVDFNNFVMEALPITADLRKLLGCGKHKFICARVRKDSPEPDYELIGKSLAARTGCARVNCETRDPPDNSQKREIVATTPTPVTLYKGEFNEVTTTVTVDFDADIGVKGKKLWQMSVWFSKSSLGDGKQTNIRRNSLDSLQRNTPLDIEGPLVFEDLAQAADLSVLGCGKFKYICAEIRKHEPEPNFDYTLRKKTSPKGCARVTCIDRKKSSPTVQFKSVQPTAVTLNIGEKNRVTTDVFVEFEPENTDEDVRGKNLWDMSVWFSKAKDGVGSSTGMVESAIDTVMKKQPVDFSNFEFQGLEMSVDLRNAIGCGKYRFICARIRKGDPTPDYTLIKPKSVTGCAPVNCEKPPVQKQEPLIIVSTAITPVTLNLGEPNTVYPDISVKFQGDEGVSGTDLWEMTIWFNKNADGSGKKTALADSTLTQNQKDQSLVITEDLVFTEIEKDLDLTEADGCGKYKYICCEIRKDSPSPSFEYEKKKPNSVRSCAKTSCERRDTPEPTVQFASTQPTGVTIYEEELNVVNTDVVVTFNEPNTDPTVAGTDLWQMQLWFSKAADGQGSSIGVIESALSEEQADQPVNFNEFGFSALEARADLTAVGCPKFQYLCVRIRKDKPEPSYKLIGKQPSQTTGCAPVQCLRGRNPTVEFASVQPTAVTVYENTATPVTTTVTVTFNEERTDEVSGDSLWQMDLWFSKGNDGAGSSSDTVTNVLSAGQSSQAVDFNRFVFRDLEITGDLTPEIQGCGKYRFICAQIRRHEPNPEYKLLGKDRSKTVGCAPVTCDKSQEPSVEFSSVSTTGVTVYEEQATTVTTTVTATFNEETTDETVAGSGLWQVRLWFSKAEDGQGSSSDEIESALSVAQASKSVNFNSFVFEDLEITADLSATGCGKYRFICAQIRRDSPDPSYQLLGKTLEATSGCAPVSCDRSQLPVVTVTSVSNTGVNLREGENNVVSTDVTVTFDRASDAVSGSNLWRVETWYSKAEDGSGFRTDVTENGLSSAQAGEALGNSFRLRFNAVSSTADQTGSGCGKYLFICAQIKKADSPDPDFDLLDNGKESTIGCSPVDCGVPTPHITPTALSITRTEVTVGQQNTIEVDVTVNFDSGNTDDVTGENLWKVIVWLSDSNDGVTGSRIAETEETITSAAKNMPLRNAGPLRFRRVAVDMNLSPQRNCKYIAYVCARFKRDAPDPTYTMLPKFVGGCAPCSCS